MCNAKFLTLIFVFLLVSFGCDANHPTGQTNAPATSTTAKPVARDPVPNLPDYPGATRTAYTTRDDSKTIKVEYVTSDPFESVLDFYGKSLKDLKDNGWKMGEIKSESAGEFKSRMTFTASKDTSAAKIVIDEKGKGNIVITVERNGK